MQLFALISDFHARFLGIDWHIWKLIGWLGNGLFFARFFVQWWSTERHQRVVIPTAFWWLSLAGSGCLLAYGLWREDSVFIFAYVFTWIPYIRNLMIGRRHRRNHGVCLACQTISLPDANYCAQCGAKILRDSSVS